MNILKICQINFGMPKISNQIKKMLPKNLSEKDIETIKQVEAAYPDAQMDIKSNFGDPIDTKYTAADEFFSRIGIYYPIYKITVQGKTGKGNLPQDGTYSTDGVIFPQGKSNSIKFKKGHSSKVTASYPIRHRQIKPSDLKKAVKLYDTNVKEIEEIRKNLEE